MIEITQELLVRYHQNQCTQEERLAVEAWLDEPETNVYLPSPERLAQLEGQIWEKIMPEIPPSKSVSPNIWKSNLWVFIGIAALLLLICGIGLRLYKPQTIRLQTLSIAYGKKAQIQLSDGTRVYLNSGSTLHYPKYFEGSKRKVIIEGEAYFDVSEDAQNPFYVETEKAQIKVLGTRFTIKAYPEEEAVSVAVEQGKIQFSAIGAKDNLVLTANQQAILQQHQLQKYPLSKAMLAWKDHVLHFDNTPLTEVIPVLERWYNIKINLKDEDLGKQRWSGTFPNPSLPKLLHWLHLTMNISYTLHDHTLTLFEE
ncbi:FecR domain-containing protein [Olivibacter ginsenosidimutans]|uniref:FecR domain-containing protein n=2 Tax=Olivibacter ginsenosidimutans TaxID=1176537 RepID=A0ABP9CC84_9SPHI